MPLLVCTKENRDLWHIFLRADGVQGAEMHIHLCA